VCVPEECQPADLEGEELREWLMLQHARIEGDNTATPTQLHYLQNLIEIGEVARSTWTGKSQYCLTSLVTLLRHVAFMHFDVLASVGINNFGSGTLSA
jgi:phage antirepressor YoqD-like protein